MAAIAISTCGSNYLACELALLPVESYLRSDNLIARLNLPNMAYPAARKPEVFAQAVRGLLALEPDPEHQASRDYSREKPLS